MTTTPERMATGICALGASAGGLDPLVDFLSRVPPNLGVAYLVVQHLSPDHESVMVKILERQTPMKVRQMTNGLEIEPDTVYVLGPGEVAAVAGRTITIVDRVPSSVDPFQHRPIDVMFSSLASWSGRAVAVVLSGTGSDGTEGLAEVRAAGGLALAQDDSAQFDGMPISAERSGVVEARGTAEALADIVARYFVDGERPDREGVLLSEVEAQILLAVEKTTGINFEDYKRATVLRRLEHRIVALGMSDQADLLGRLRTDPQEADNLAHDILIGVTSFFRDQNVYDQLSRDVLPDLVRRAAEQRLPVRVWSVGCATGQEAYSIAMALVEIRDEVSPSTPVKVFATDVHEGSLAVASKGWYSEADMAAINPERRERFFGPEADGWRVRPELRGLLAFSRHNLLTDPPFTGIDFISCRNTLIYFSSGAQRDAFWAFGFSLRDGGILMLGETESLGAAGPDYDTVGKGLYRLVNNRTSLSLRRRPRSSPLSPRGLPTAAIRWDAAPPPTRPSGAHDRLLAANGIGGLEVDRAGRLVHVYGVASSWLRFRAGVSLDDAIALVDDVALRAAAAGLLRRLEGGDDIEPVEVSFEHERVPRIIELTAERSDHAGRETFIVHGRLRDRTTSETPKGPTEPEPSGSDATKPLREQLRENQLHLETLKRQLDEAVRHQEYSEQQLTATNEELLVSNEELQASIEELSSTNEELRTVADENETRLRDVLALGADLEQVLNATDIGVLLLDQDAIVRRFSGSCSRYFNILDSDIGRPFDHIRATFDDHELREAVARAATTREAVDLMIRPSAGFDRTLRASIVPYSGSGAHRGVSLTFVDVTIAQDRERQLQALFDRLTDSLRFSGIALWEGTRGVDETWASENFAEVSGVPVEQWDAFPDIDSIHPEDRAMINDQIAEIHASLGRGEPYAPSQYDYRILDPAGQFRSINVRVSAFERDGRMTSRAVIADVTAERQRTRRLEELNRDLADFTNLASHDLRAPLRGVRNLLGFLRDDHGDTLSDEAKGLIDRTEQRVEAMQLMLDGLLDYARATQTGTERETFQFRPWLEGVCDAVTDHNGIVVKVSTTIDEIETEKTLLATCVRNLVDNAVKHHPGPEGTVRVTAQEAGSVMVLTVADDGAGIAPEDQERIFRPFQHSGNDGSGIGLATVHKVVHDRDGSIKLLSEPGEGSSFTIVWPLATPVA